VWLKEWASSNQKAGFNAEVGKFIGIYFAFGIGAASLSVAQTLILWIFCSIEVRLLFVTGGSVLGQRG
jgi:ATP-binding cassette subfamily C (CFTR/MRP) protein 1